MAQNVRQASIFNYWELLSLFRSDELIFVDESFVVFEAYNNIILMHSGNVVVTAFIPH